MGLSVDIVGGLGGGADQTGNDAPDLTLYRLYKPLMTPVLNK
jgi:hypothetical protein